MTNQININPLKEYIGSLTENINKNNIPKIIDLVLDGGAFNGGYQLGILLYLKELENLKLLNINRISGCSIGALLGILYFSNKLEKAIHLYEQFMKYIREKCHLKYLISIIAENINCLDDITVFNNKLYIVYNDIINIKPVVVSTYKTKKDLIDALVKTSYIPYMMGDSIQYKGCCDGITPYIFPKSDKQLYISLIPTRKLKNILFIKNEVNIWSRLLTGIVDINNFFAGSHSEFCSYVDRWSIKNKLILRLKELLVLLIILLINSYNHIIHYIPKSIKQNPYILRLHTILSFLYKDIFSHILL